MTTRPLRVMEEEPPGKHGLKTQFLELRARGLSWAKITKRPKVAKATPGLHSIFIMNDRGEQIVSSGHGVPNPLSARANGHERTAAHPRNEKSPLSPFGKGGFRQQCPVRKLHKRVRPPSPQSSPPMGGGRVRGK